MKLTEAQLKQYQEDGYLKYGDLLTPEEVTALQEAYMATLETMRQQRALASVRGGATADGKDTQVYQIRVAHLKHERFDRVMRDARLLDIVEQLIGPNIRVVLHQGLYKPPQVGGVLNWHQDDFYFRVDKEDAVVTCWLALDDATVENGCMWVAPGMHREMINHTPVTNGSGFEILTIDEAVAVPVLLQAGQCMFHHGLAPHRTLANTSNSHRRALAIHFMDATARPLGDGRQHEPSEHMPMVRGHGVQWRAPV